jgi:hypothetical protein
MLAREHPRELVGDALMGNDFGVRAAERVVFEPEHAPGASFTCCRRPSSSTTSTPSTMLDRIATMRVRSRSSASDPPSERVHGAVQRTRYRTKLVICRGRAAAAADRRPHTAAPLRGWTIRGARSGPPGRTRRERRDERAAETDGGDHQHCLRCASDRLSDAATMTKSSERAAAPNTLAKMLRRKWERTVRSGWSSKSSKSSGRVGRVVGWVRSRRLLAHDLLDRPSFIDPRACSRIA